MSEAIVRMVKVLLLSFAVAGCEDQIITTMRAGPTNAEALAAIQEAVRHGVRVMEVPLPAGVTVASAAIRDCQPASPQSGYRCSVSVATADVPVLGGLAADIVLRFAKLPDGRWAMYLN